MPLLQTALGHIPRNAFSLESKITAFWVSECKHCMPDRDCGLMQAGTAEKPKLEVLEQLLASMTVESTASANTAERLKAANSPAEMKEALTAA